MDEFYSFYRREKRGNNTSVSEIFTSRCKKCHRKISAPAYIRARQKRRYKANKKEHHVEELKKLLQQCNRENIKHRPETKKKLRRKRWNISRRIRRKTDINFLLRCFLGQAICRTYRLIGTKKEKTTIEILGYSPEQLKKRLEMNLTEQMNWKNYGSCWEIDHHIPITYFIKKGVRNPKIINALSNLQPLTLFENRSKHDKIINKNHHC